MLMRRLGCQTKSHMSFIVQGRVIGGWLALLIFGLGFLGPIAAFKNYESTEQNMAPLYSKVPRLQLAVYVYDYLLLAYGLVSIYTAYYLLYGKNKGVAATARYNLVVMGFLSVTACFSVPVIILLPLNTNDPLWRYCIKGAIQAILVCGVWYVYLARSKRVKETYDLE